MIFLITHHKTGISVSELQQLTGIKRYQTCWTIAHKIRKAMADRNARYKLTGLVETDDTAFGAQKVSGKRGRGVDKKTNVIVSVKVNPQNRAIFVNMIVVKGMEKQTIAEALREQLRRPRV